MELGGMMNDLSNSPFRNQLIQNTDYVRHLCNLRKKHSHELLLLKIDLNPTYMKINNCPAWLLQKMMNNPRVGNIKHKFKQCPCLDCLEIVDLDVKPVQLEVLEQVYWEAVEDVGAHIAGGVDGDDERFQ